MSPYIRIMYVLPMILGRTYDIKKNTVGVDIFSPKSFEKPREIEESFYSSSFKTVKSFSDVKEVLEINGDLSLGIKAGFLKFRGMGSYVKESLKSQNSVDILTKVSYRTVSKSLPLSAKPLPLWFKTGEDYLGTHFVRSILYGGDLIACVRFKAVKNDYLQDIKATIKASLAGKSALDLVGEGKLETLDKNLEKKASMEINYFATVPLEGVPNTINGLRDLVKNFKQHVTKVNGGIGVPVEVELGELSILNQTISFIKNTDLDTELGFFEEYFDDLLATKSLLKNWISALPNTLSPQQEKEISGFSDRLSLILNKFIDTVANVNLEKGPSQLDEAKAAYKEGKSFAMAGKFRKELKKLMIKITPPKNVPNRGAEIYVHYGAKECVTDNHTSMLFSGYLASSLRNTTGSGLNYLCMPMQPSRSAEYPLDSWSGVAGVKYGLLETKPPDMNVDNIILKGVVCAVCFVKQRPTISTILGRSDCPEEDDGWTLQYSGFIMSSSDANRSENICVDSKRGSHTDSEIGFFDQSLAFVLTKRGDQHKFIPCAVCSK